MVVMGIETSCDETSVAVVEHGVTVLSNETASSARDYAHAGGVIPEQAARRQVESVIPVVHAALDSAEKHASQLDAIAVTHGPGLLTSLLVGVTAARTLASTWQKPLMGVHHTHGHLSSPWLECDDQIHFPVLALSVSGGHTELWLRHSHTRGELLGRTRDDAAGEAFDKGAALLGLPYPGGPSIAACAGGAPASDLQFPQPLARDAGYDWSFSGLKTALKYHLRDNVDEALSAEERSTIAFAYQDAICRHLTSRVVRAAKAYPSITEVHVVGGVSANTHLRSLLADALAVPVRVPVKMQYCTDNAAMIAASAFFRMKEEGNAVFADFCADTNLHIKSYKPD